MIRIPEGKQKASYFRGLAFNAIKDCPECRVTEPTSHASLLILLIPITQPFRAEVEGISKRLVDALERLPAGHEHLGANARQFEIHGRSCTRSDVAHGTGSKEHAYPFKSRRTSSWMSRDKDRFRLSRHFFFSHYDDDDCSMTNS